MGILYTQEGIKSVGVGRRGSKPMSSTLVKSIVKEIQNGDVPDVIKGAFCGALWIKGISSSEGEIHKAFKEPVFLSAENMIGSFATDVPDDIKKYCIGILNKEKLSVKEATVLSEYILLPSANKFICGLVASVLRVRYETDSEYEGLLRGIEGSFSKTFQDTVSSGETIVQIAEPFDGVTRSYLVTPILADIVAKKGYCVVNICGRSSGPKYGNNLRDIGVALQANFLKNPRDVIKGVFYLDQKDLSHAMDMWVDYRRSIIKRPFMATLERLVNPLRANILIASAFHPSYGEKMIKIAEKSGFKKIIIIRNGLEGTTSFALKRSTKILISCLNGQGKFDRREISFDAQSVLAETIKVEEKLQDPSLKENERLIRLYLKEGKTDYRLFDLRIKAVRVCLEQLQIL